MTKKRLLAILIAVAIVAWLVKDRLVPMPETPGEPSPFRRSAPPTARPAPSAQPAADAPQPAAAEDDLTVINGIGEKLAGRLRDLGITTVAQLAAADAAAVSAQLSGASEAQVAAWTEQARRLA